VNFDHSNYLLLRHRKVPAPFSTKELTSNNINEGGNNQKLILFNLGNAINFVIKKVFILYFHFFQSGSDYVINDIIYTIVGFSWKDFC
jgi:hypothetical protein